VNPTPTLLIAGSSKAIHIKKKIKKQTEKTAAQIRFQSQRPHTITSTKDNINMDSAIAVSMNARR